MDNSKDFLGKEITIKIDRPLNSNHPKHWFKYELNYWYVPNTISWDSEELDAYVLWVNEVIEEFNWKCIAVIHRTNDDDDKLIVVPIWAEFTDEEIRNLTNFQEQYFKSIIIR